MWNFYDDCLTDHLRLLPFAAKFCTSSGVKLLRWLPDWQPTTTGFCCETLNPFWCETFPLIAWATNYEHWLLLRNLAPVLVYNYYGHCLRDYLRLLAFAAKLCTSSGVKLLRWLLDWLPTITGFCCETLHQFWCETFTVISWRTTHDYWLLLRYFEPVLVWNFYGDCLTEHLRLMAFAATLWTSSGVKFLRWLLDGPLTTTGFCYETLHQFWCETFTMIALRTSYDYWLLSAKLCTSSAVKLLRWLPDWLPTTTGFCRETWRQFWCETFTMIALRTAYDYWLLLRNVAPVLVWNFYVDCLTD